MAYERPAAPRGNRAPLPTSAPARGTGSTGGEGGTSAPQRATPTPKMLEFARNVAETLGINMPDDVETSFDACRAFLDANPLPPTDKQINLADRIAAEKSIEVPDDARKSRRAMSDWLDTQMGQRK